MENPAEILKLAQQRAADRGLPYAGALTPAEAHALWQAIPGACLVDVRTRAEWVWVGRIPGALEIEWNRYPGGTPNPDFLTELGEKAEPQAVVMFLCRSGARSHQAASLASQVGYQHAYNVLEGFEGDLDANGQRGKVGGWRHAGLPWKS
jgi:rhodanese-related sulfurtransferase